MSKLFRHYLATMVTQGTILLLGALSGVLAARLLGPEGRGELAVIILWPSAVVYLIGSFGLHDAATFFAARHPRRLNALFTALQLLGAAQILLFGVLAYFLLPLVLTQHRPEVITLARWFLLFLPVGFNSLYMLKLLQGSLQIRQFNLVRLFIAAWYTGLLVVLYFLNRVNLTWIVGGQLFGYGFAFLLHCYFLRHTLRITWEWDPSIFRPLLHYGVKAQFSSASIYLNCRLDQLVISILLPPVAFGYYVAAVTLAESVQIIPAAIGGVTLPTAAAQEDSSEAHRVIAHSFRLVALFLLACVVPLFVLIPYLVPFFFGVAFLPAVTPCRILLLAGVPLAFGGVLSDSLRALNRPQVPGYAALGGTGIAVALLALLLPRFGLLGAAYAVLGATSANLLFLLWYARSRLQLSWQELFTARGGSLETSLAPQSSTHLKNQIQP